MEEITFANDLFEIALSEEETLYIYLEYIYIFGITILH